MIQITEEFKKNVLTALMEVRQNYSGSDTKFAQKYELNPSVYSRLKSGESALGLLSDASFLNIGMLLNISINERKWHIAKTDVYKTIENDVLFCQAYSKAKIFVDDCELGKTVAARHLSRTLKNCFYVDASQAKSKQLFIREIAKSIGVDSAGKYNEVKNKIKYALKSLPNPIVIVDDAGDLEPKTFLELKEFWNATENVCGWYMIGDDSLQTLINKCISSGKAGFRALFSRFSSNYNSVSPIDINQKQQFYHKLLSDVLSINMTDKTLLPQIIAKCMKKGASGQIGGLRRAESILILSSNG
jgi:AAA domain